MNFIFFTKTNWNEPPRIRHQLALILAEAGHKIIFYEKPAFLRNVGKAENVRNIEFKRTAYLVHHQLRVQNFLGIINSWFEQWSIRNSAVSFSDENIIINFNYDYFFLRNIFPKNKIITIINDDFQSQARFNRGKHVSQAIKRTSLISDVFLTVSEPLQKKLSHFKECNLFLPWADCQVFKPKKFNLKQNTLLIWGYIDGRIDFNFLEKSIKDNSNYKFLIVGPISRNVKAGILDLERNFKNVHVLGPQDLTQLPLDQILCAFIPYKRNTEFGQSVTILNKGFQLLAAGLPLIIRGMPNFLKSGCIFDVADNDNITQVLANIEENYSELQNNISGLIDQNSREKRYQQFMSYVDSINVI